MVAQVPANRWTGTALTTSSTLIFSNNKIPDPDTRPPIEPIIIASVGSTYAQDAVIDTKPAIGPVIMNIGSGFFIT